MLRHTTFAILALGFIRGGPLRAEPAAKPPSSACRFSVVPRVEGPIDPQVLSAITRDYERRVVPGLIKELGARCSDEDWVEFQPRVVAGKLVDQGMPAMLWTTEAIVEVTGP